MEHINTFNASAKQDEFVANILNFKRNGTFVDIGSHASIEANNSYYFDNQLDWRGVCIEIESHLAPTYESRKNTKLINKDATRIHYSALFQENSLPTVIDYLSLDIDAASIDVLKIMPLKEYSFSVITIEHDFYLHGEKYRGPQRQILQENGYLLVCSNVLVEQAGFESKVCPFEDWWIDPKTIDATLFNKVKSEDLLPSQIIARFSK